MKLSLKYFILIFLILFNKSHSIIYIFTTAFNRPEFIEMQYKTFKRFLKGDYEYIVFNDAIDPKMEKEIISMCKKYKIRCYRVPQNLHKCKGPKQLSDYYNDISKKKSFISSFRHSDSLDYAFQILGFDHKDIILIIDSDMFLVKDFNVRQYIKNYGAASFRRGINAPMRWHPSPEISIFNMPLLPNPRAMIFKAGLMSYVFVDTFHLLRYYFYNNPEVRFREMEYVKFKELANVSENNLMAKGFSKNQTELIMSYLKNIYELNPEFKKKFFFRDRTGLIEKTFLNIGEGLGKNKYNHSKIKILQKYINRVINSNE